MGDPRFKWQPIRLYLQQKSFTYITRIGGGPKSSKSWMTSDDHDLVLKPMVTFGSLILRNPYLRSMESPRPGTHSRTRWSTADHPTAALTPEWRPERSARGKNTAAGHGPPKSLCHGRMENGWWVGFPSTSEDCTNLL
jgi:hypothetical protein